MRSLKEGCVVGTIVSVNPFRCRLWSLHDRIEGSVSEENCRDEMESFLKHGQLIPALGRPIKGDAEFDVEIVCGARRLFVARQLNKELCVELKQMTDIEAFVAMDIENRQRKDVSPYERGVCYARLLRTGLFKTQDEIARALRVSKAHVSRLLKLAHLPAVVIEAFSTPLDLQEGWGLRLSETLDD